MNLSQSESSLMLSLLEEKLEAITNEVYKNDDKIEALKERKIELNNTRAGIIALKNRVMLSND